MTAQGWSRGMWPVLGAAILGLLWAIAACDLSPRSPEPPGDGNQGRLVNLSDPDSVLLQIQVGLLDGFITSYMRAFTSDFVFHPDDRDSIALAAQNPGVFDDWTFEVERQVMQLVLSQSPRTVDFASAESTVVVPGSVVVLDEDYDLTVGTVSYEGRAEFQMRLDGNEWRIFKWIDRRRAGSSLSSWSFLKGENR